MRARRGGSRRAHCRAAQLAPSFVLLPVVVGRHAGNPVEGVQELRRGGGTGRERGVWCGRRSGLRGRRLGPEASEGFRHVGRAGVGKGWHHLEQALYGMEQSSRVAAGAVAAGAVGKQHCHLVGLQRLHEWVGILPAVWKLLGIRPGRHEGFWGRNEAALPVLHRHRGRAEVPGQVQSSRPSREECEGYRRGHRCKVALARQRFRLS
mmetsp:Transcript_20748/g.52988  ORF Transcript_20748/g.52988 Transcript_20748/m.52988 type:complete len:207 (-) Transcript_20748:358-978(-)